MQSHQFLPDRSSINLINKINLSTGEITTLPFEVKYEQIKLESGSLVGMGAIGLLSLYNDEVVVSLNRDNSLYKIQKDKVTPFIRWNISTPANSYDFPLSAHGYSGNYLFINYRRNNIFFTYMENTKTGKTYNISNLTDDVYQTNGNCLIKSMQQEGYFYFRKESSEIKGNSVGSIPLKNGPVIFIVKSK